MSRNLKKIPKDAFVIIWVTPTSYSHPLRLRGTDIFYVMCLPGHLEALTDQFRYHRIVLAEDNEAGMEYVNEIAIVERGRSIQRKSELKDTLPPMPTFKAPIRSLSASLPS